jgi:hypothetical protein
MTTTTIKTSHIGKLTSSIKVNRSPIYWALLFIVSLGIVIFTTVHTSLTVFASITLDPKSITYVGDSIIQSLPGVNSTEFYALMFIGVLFMVILGVMCVKSLSNGFPTIIPVISMLVVIIGFSGTVANAVYIPTAITSNSPESKNGPYALATNEMKNNFAKSILGEDVDVLSPSENIYMSEGEVYSFVKTWDEKAVTLTLEKKDS